MFLNFFLKIVFKILVLLFEILKINSYSSSFSSSPFSKIITSSTVDNVIVMRLSIRRSRWSLLSSRDKRLGEFIGGASF